ncbi:hypothetical protein SUGI_0239570 [Cryptomeria japonica]|uniref:non-specific lipid transfer protein GPI-anchored 9 n=1 Tax=Cryptomeria japonica TaxID=3369 RepID=UPI002408D56A|nr:non-specific lipid transfer protein GPI-anchored 9 [Cryptomeria japonica]GLJ14770.1 hypothetical protein SUGI_0239570 [Cryptomeria japonica]
MGLRIKMAVIALIMVLSDRGAEAADGGSCLSALTPCAQYLNSTSKPPADCCTPLLDVINTQQECLCNVFNSNLFKQANISIAQALKLPALCGKNVTADACTKVNGTTSTPSAPASATPASRPGSESTPTNGAGVDSFKIFLPLLAFVFLGAFRSFPW